MWSDIDQNEINCIFILIVETNILTDSIGLSFSLSICIFLKTISPCG